MPRLYAIVVLLWASSVEAGETFTPRPMNEGEYESRDGRTVLRPNPFVEGEFLILENGRQVGKITPRPFTEGYDVKFMESGKDER